ncbi:MAG TPA: alpha/beta fold hydrolase [Kofleriaceae bacterium]|nr:alpha/beta fold hydrolase [Kofleriaceae bacterium]
MPFEQGNEEASPAPAMPIDHAVATADGARLLHDIIAARGGGAHEVAAGVAELVPEDRDAVMRAIHGEQGNAFADEVQQAIGKPRHGSALNLKEKLYEARLDLPGRREGVVEDARDVGNQDIIFEQLAHKGAYGELDNRKLADWGYQEAGGIRDPESGFYALLYLPLEAATDRQAATARALYGGQPPPVLAFAGTENKRDLADDANREGVGTYQFASNAGKIQALMQAAHGKVVSTGHSLGGALAQLAAARFPDHVSRVVTFQSPAINASEVAKLDAYNKQAAPEDQVHSTHHRVEGDLVHMGGQQLTTGDVFTYSSVGLGNPMDHTQLPLERLAAARGNLVPGVDGDDRLVGVEKTSSKAEKQGWFPKFAEKARKALLAPARDDDMEPYVRMWRSVEELLKSGQFSRQYVLDIIRDSDQLTEVQKLKMRDQVELLSGADPARPASAEAVA